jgi:predicted peptidase
MITALDKTGIYQLEFFKGKKHYSIYMPDNVREYKPRSLIMILHWGGPVYQYKGLEILSGLAIPALGKLGAIIVAPDCPSGRWDDPASESYVLELHTWLIEQYGIEKKKTLLAGYSLGGIGTWYIAGRNQGEFRGALIISAKPMDETTNVDWSIPLYIIHGRNDEVFPLQYTASAVDLLKKKDRSVEFRLVEDTTHYETHRFIEPVKDTVPWVREIWDEIR